MNQTVVLASDVLEELRGQLIRLANEMRELRGSVASVRSRLSEPEELYHSLLALERQMSETQQQTRTLARRIETVMDVCEQCEIIIRNRVRDGLEDSRPLPEHGDNHSSPKSYHSSDSLFNWDDPMYTTITTEGTKPNGNPL